MRRLIVIACVIAWPLLTASMCATVAPPPAVAPVEHPQCLPLANYSPEYEKVLGDAVAALPANSPIIAAMGDFAAMRAADRACLAGS